MDNDGRMKWLIALMLLATVSAAQGELRPEEGGQCSGQGCMIILRNPFYIFSNVTVAAPTITIVIDYPEDGATYYTNTLMMNTTVTDGTPPINCYYNINGAAWVAYDCVNQTITFPEGAVTLTVNATDSVGAEDTDAVTFDIQTRALSPAGDIRVLILGSLLVLALLYYANQVEADKRCLRYTLIRTADGRIIRECRRNNDRRRR